MGLTIKEVKKAVLSTILGNMKMKKEHINGLNRSTYGELTIDKAVEMADKISETLVEKLEVAL